MAPPAVYNAQLVCNNLGMGIANAGLIGRDIPITATVLSAMYYPFYKRSPTPFGNIDLPAIGEAARLAYWTPTPLIAFNVPAEKLSRRSGRHRSRRRANQLRSNRVDHRYYIRPGELVHPLGCCEELSPVVVAVVKKNRRVDAKEIC